MTDLLAEGWTLAQTAERSGVSYAWVKANAPRLRAARSQPAPLPSPLGEPEITPGNDDTDEETALIRPLALHELSPIARDCLDDFARFRARYFGRISSPWQEDAAYQVIKRLATPDKEYVVINVAPGSGKSTLFTHDIPAWVTCRSRSIRGFIGSGTQTTANSYTGRLRNTFERPIPMQAQSEDLALGLARDADSTLIADYGLFKPPSDIGAPWSKSQFTVAQVGETRVGEKEATWTAFGEDTRFLGWRVNLIVWDDLVTAASVRTAEAIEAQRIWWINEAQTRLEPGGLLILQGQRLHAEDLYRFCLDMETGHTLLDEWYEDLGVEQEPTGKKYQHIVYRAHYEDHCRAAEDPSMHRMSAPPYDPANPNNSGCLIDPVRLPWRELASIKAQPLTNFDVVYQQEDSSPSEVLVPKIYIEGGVDPETGESYIGCWDHERATWQLPPAGSMKGHRFVAVTVDPSPTKFWSIQYWLYVEPERADQFMGYRYLIDQLRTPMTADSLLDWNVEHGKWMGVLEDWWLRGTTLGIPYTHLIVEVNAAQKFLLQYSWFKDWTQLRSVLCLPHTTGINKTDKDFGVGTLRPHYRYGRVRLPGDLGSRAAIKPLVNELTHWPAATTDDCVMANWFFEHNLPNLAYTDREHPSLYGDIPSWMEQSPIGLLNLPVPT